MAFYALAGGIIALIGGLMKDDLVIGMGIGMGFSVMTLLVTVIKKTDDHND